MVTKRRWLQQAFLVCLFAAGCGTGGPHEPEVTINGIQHELRVSRCGVDGSVGGPVPYYRLMVEFQDDSIAEPFNRIAFSVGHETENSALMLPGVVEPEDDKTVMIDNSLQADTYAYPTGEGDAQIVWDEISVVEDTLVGSGNIDILTDVTVSSACIPKQTTVHGTTCFRPNPSTFRAPRGTSTEIEDQEEMPDDRA